MNSFPLLFVAGAFLLSPLLTTSCGGSAATEPPASAGAAGASRGSHAAGAAGTGTAGSGSAGAPMTDTCKVDADCAWGEVSKELLKAGDCPCLYGCGYLPQTITTRERRAAQYVNLCNPQKDGQGNSCGIDDCAPPGSLMCVDGTCSTLINGSDDN
ncbi:MAG: hypothetical protein ABI488_07780 [Polyangiaceae bacterium]